MMPQVLVARVTCPSCQNQFQTPIEQVLDIRADPNAKMRVLNGLVNVAVCPHCRTGGALNLPFFYHDPDKELALIYMPIELGQDNLERQKVIGDFTRNVMDGLPPEERKAYLLQPHVFLTLENLMNKILDADGITPDMIEEQRAKADLLRRMVEATSNEVLEAIIKENDDAIDADVFRLLSMNMEIAQASGQAAALQKLTAVHSKLLELSSEGQMVKARSELVEALRAEPTREKLLELLVEAPDEDMRELLIVFGRPLLDYPFFQSLTSQIESAPDENEKKRLTALRTEILGIRDRLDEEARALYAERSALLRDLLLSSDPESLARRRFPELDQVFFNVLAANMEEARNEGNKEAFEALQALWALVLQLTEETLPPEIRLLNRLMDVEDDAEIDKLLQQNQALVTEQFAQLIEKAKSKLEEEEGPPEATARMTSVLEKTRKVLAENPA